MQVAAAPYWEAAQYPPDVPLQSKDVVRKSIAISMYIFLCEACSFVPIWAMAKYVEAEDDAVSCYSVDKRWNLSTIYTQ